MFQSDEVTVLVKRMRLVWFAMMASVALFTGVIWTLVRRGVRFPPLPPMAVTYGAVIVLMMLPLARFVRRRIDQPSAYAGAGEISRRWQTGWIVSQAMREAVGLLGAVLGLLYGSTAWVLGFGCASLAAIVMTPPWEHEIRLRLQRANTDPGPSPGMR